MKQKLLKIISLLICIFLPALTAVGLTSVTKEKGTELKGKTRLCPLNSYKMSAYRGVYLHSILGKEGKINFSSKDNSVLIQVGKKCATKNWGELECVLCRPPGSNIMRPFKSTKDKTFVRKNFEKETQTFLEAAQCREKMVANMKKVGDYGTRIKRLEDKIDCAKQTLEHINTFTASKDSSEAFKQLCSHSECTKYIKSENISQLLFHLARNCDLNRALRKKSG